MYSLPKGFPVPRPQWRERADSCPSCGKRFTFFTSKGNCPCCGELFCSDCLQAEVTLSEGREPVAVCLNCFSLIQDHRREAAKHMESVPAATPNSSRLSATPRTTPRREAPTEAPTASSIAQHVKTLTTHSAALRAENEQLLSQYSTVEASLVEAKRAITEKETANRRLQEVITELQERVRSREAAQGLPQAASSSSLAQPTSAAQAPHIQQPSQSHHLSELHTPLEAQIERKAALYERQLKDQAASHAHFAKEKAEEVSRLQQRHTELERRCLDFESELKEAREQLQALKDVNKMLQEELQTAAAAATEGTVQTPSTEDNEGGTISELRQRLVTLEQERAALSQQVAAMAAEPVATHAPLLSVGDDILHRCAVPVPSTTDLLPETRWHQPSQIKPVVEVLAECPTLAPSIPQADGFLQWGAFDTMAVSEAVPCVLAHVAREVADRWSLFNAAHSVLRERFIHMAVMLSANYSDAPYHNAVHAADVLQSVVALTTACTPLFQSMTSLEKRAVAFAAMAHDVRHPGRAAPFLKRCFDPIHFSFNGVSPLEQLHTSTAWALLAHEANDFTADLSNEEVLLFHDLVREFILHTDMTKHDADVAAVGQRAHDGSLDYSKPEDRKQVLGLLVHAADIGAQAKGVAIALKWLTVVDEMHLQGDAEAARGLPISPGCERGGSVEGGQLFFLTRFVFPIFDVVHQLFPEVTQPLEKLRAVFDYYQRQADRHDAFPQSIVHRNAVDARLADAEAQVEEAREALRAQEAKASTQQLCIQSLKESADSADEARRMLQDQLQSLESQLARSTARVAELETQHNIPPPPTETANATAVDALDAEVRALKERLDEVQKEKDALLDSHRETTAAQARQENVEHAAELAKLREEVDVWKQRAETIKVRAAEVETALKEAKASVVSMRADVETRDKENVRWQQQYASQKAVQDKLQTQLSDLTQMIQEERNNVKAQMAVLKKDCEDARAAAAASSSALEAKEAELRAVTQQNTERGQRHSDSLRAAQVEHSAEKAELTTLLETTRQALATAQARAESSQHVIAEQRGELAKLQEALSSKDDQQRTTLTQLKEKAAQLQSATQDLKAREERMQKEESRLTDLKRTLETAQDKNAKDQQSVQEMSARLKQASSVLTKEKAAFERARSAWEQARSAQERDVSASPRVAELDAREAALVEKAQDLVAREHALEEKLTALNAQVAELEAREGCAAVLSEQLAIIAEKMNRQQRRLRLREARANGLGPSLSSDRQPQRSASVSTVSPSRQTDEPHPSSVQRAVPVDEWRRRGLDTTATASSLSTALKSMRDALDRCAHPLVPLVAIDD